MLTLADRVARHFTTSLTTVRTAARNGRKLLADFAANRARPAAEPARTYLWPADQPEARALADLLALHGIRVRQLGARRRSPRPPARQGGRGRGAAARFAAGTYAVSTAQPLGNLVQALLELDSPMNQAFLDRQRQRLEQNLDAEFYDITAWSLPLAYNLRDLGGGGETGRRTPARCGRSVRRHRRGRGTSAGWCRRRGSPPTGWRRRSRTGRSTYRVALAGRSAGEAARAIRPAPCSSPATATAPRSDETLAVLLQETALTAQALASSYELKGLSLGSNDMPAVRPVRVGLLSGEGVDATSFGFLWYLLDRQIGVNHDRLDLARSGRSPSPTSTSWSSRTATTTTRSATRPETSLDAWIKAGGVLVAIGDAVTWLQDQELTTIKRWEAPKKDDKADSSPTTRSRARARPTSSSPSARSSPRAPCSPPACSRTTR